MNNFDGLIEEIKKMDRVRLQKVREEVEYSQKKAGGSTSLFSLLYLTDVFWAIEARECVLAWQEEDWKNKVNNITNPEELEVYRKKLLKTMRFHYQSADADCFADVFSKREEELREKLRKERSFWKKVKDFFIEIDVELLFSFLLLITFDLGTAYLVNFFFPKLKHDEIMTILSFVVWVVVSFFLFAFVAINRGRLKDFRIVLVGCSLPLFLSFAGFKVLYEYPNIPLETVIFCFSFGIMFILCFIVIFFFYVLFN